MPQSIFTAHDVQTVCSGGTLQRHHALHGGEKLAQSAGSKVQCWQHAACGRQLQCSIRRCHHTSWRPT
jgi:hypothetical protein